MPAIEGMTPETLGLNAVVKFNAACPVVTAVIKDGTRISTGTFSGKDTMTVEIPGDYVFKDTCECSSTYTVMYAGDEVPGSSDTALLEAINDAAAADAVCCSETQAAIVAADATNAAGLAEVKLAIENQVFDSTAIVTAVTAEGNETQAAIVAADATNAAGLAEVKLAIENQTFDSTAIVTAVTTEGNETQAGLVANTAAVSAVEAAITDVTGTNCAGDPALEVNITCEWRPAFFAAGCDIISGQVKYSTVDGSVIAAVVTHDPSGVLAQGDDAMALTEIDPEQYPNGLPCAKDDFDNTLKVGVTKTIDVAANDTLCANFAAKTYTTANVTNVTVADNGDGTFDVTPAPGACGAAWSFDYTVTCAEGSATATVSGEIEDTLVTHAFSTSNETTVNLGIRLSGGGTYDVDWGDGTVETVASSATTNATHTYGANYTGDITITYSSCSVIKEFRSTQGHWDFDIGTLPVGLTYYHNTGQNTTSGDISTLPVGLTTYISLGQNTTSGDIGTLPVGLTYYNNQGQNDTTGDIGTLPAGLTYYNNQGQNDTTGDIGTLPAGLTYYANTGQNDTTGDIGTLPAGLTYYANTGQNTTTGDIGALPVGLTVYRNEGQNTTSGDISTLPVGLTYYLNTGQNTATMPNTTWTGSSTMRYFAQHGNNTQSDVDNMLVALANGVTTWVTEKVVNVGGNNAAPSATGTAAIPTIQAAGATVTTN